MDEAVRRLRALMMEVADDHPVVLTARLDARIGWVRFLMAPLQSLGLYEAWGLAPAALWAGVAILAELALRACGRALIRGEEDAFWPFRLVGVFVSMWWSLMAVALFISNVPGAAVAGTIALFGVMLYAIIFNHHSGPELAALLAPPLTALLGVSAWAVEGEMVSLVLVPLMLLIGLALLGAWITHATSVKLRAANRSIARERDALDARVKERTAALAEAMERAEAASLAKSSFVANMSHELRTPLTGVIGYAEMIQEDLLDGDGRADPEDAARILSAARHLLGLINEVLDLSKIEAGRVQLTSEEVDLERLLQGVLDTARPLAHGNGNRLGLEVAETLGLGWVDPARLRQCLLNLVGNACKFTRGGRVTVHAERRGEDLEIRVTDTGIGMDEGQIARLFQPFVQGDASITRRFGGTGLGLAITAKLMAAMGGAVSVTSTPGQGSVFTLRLPIDPCLRAAA